MARINKNTPQVKTAEGAIAKHINPHQELRRSVMGCLLWEREFYEEGEAIADRIKRLIPLVSAEKCATIAIEARSQMNLRHVPLFIAREMSRHATHKGLVARVLGAVIQRPDELTEFLSIYWKDKKEPLSAQVKKGLAVAFTKFNEYSLAKYNQDKEVKLRDVLFLCHAKPKDPEQDALWKRLIAGTLATPETWEVELSASTNKLASWSSLLLKEKLGGLALLRNLRNMTQVGVNEQMIKWALLKMKTDRILPYRFIAAARHAPNLEPELESAMFRSLAESNKMMGKTCVLVDVSGSMAHKLSSKSDLTRLDAACGLAMLLREICPEFQVLTFSDKTAVVPPRRGFALRDAIVTSQQHNGTYLGAAVELVSRATLDIERLIVITDEQSHDKVRDPLAKKAYMINVASNKNGVGYGKWTHLDGFSESIVLYMQELEATSSLSERDKEYRESD